VAEFSHDIPPIFICIIGGYVYRGKEFPTWQGTYFFSDWGNSRNKELGQIWAMRRNAEGNWETHQVDNNLSPLRKCHSFGIDDDGNLYAMSFADGKIYKLIELPAQK
jgi:glucose/arabinose dehydrogenase